MSRVNLILRMICNGWFCAVAFLAVTSVVAQTESEGRERNARPIQVQRLVTRDLEIYQPEGECSISVDGILFSDGTAIPWWNVLSMDAAEVSEATQAVLKSRQAGIGNLWLLLRNRIARGESYGLSELSAELLSAYDQIREANTAVDLGDTDQAQRRFAGEIELLRWLIVSRDDNLFVMKMNCFLRQHLSAKVQKQDVGVSRFLQAYRLVDDWRVDKATGLCWQIPPAGSQEQVDAFVREFSQQNDRALDRDAVRTLNAYRLLSAAAESGQLRQQWLLLDRSLCFSEPIWQELIDALTGEVQDLSKIQGTLTQLEQEGQWAEVFAANWLVGRNLLGSASREHWTLGATCLLKIAFLQEQSQRKSRTIEQRSHDPMHSTAGQLEWAKQCLHLVADKFGEVGEPGKMRSLLQHLERLETE